MSTSSVQDSIRLSHLATPSNLSISASSSSSTDENSTVSRTETIASSSIAPSDVAVASSSASSPIINIQDEISISLEELTQWVATNRKIELIIRRMLNLSIPNVNHVHPTDIQRQERIEMEKMDIVEQQRKLSNELKFLESIKQKINE